MTAKVKKETAVEGGISSIGGADALVVGHSAAHPADNVPFAKEPGVVGGQVDRAAAPAKKVKKGEDKPKRVRSAAPKAAYYVTLVQNVPGSIPQASVRTFAKKKDFETFLEGEANNTEGLTIKAIVRGHLLKVEKRTAYRLTAAQGE